MKKIFSNVIKNVFFSLAVILLFFGGAEILSRIIFKFPDIKVTAFMEFGQTQGFCVKDKILGFRLKPKTSFASYSINSLGFRGNKFTIKKPKNTYRIFILGGSTTFGSNVENNETYPFILEKLLNLSVADKNYRFEVINAGVPGYISQHHLIRCQDEFDRYAPDMYLYMLGPNDSAVAFEFLEGSYNPEKAKLLLVNNPNLISNLHHLLYKRSSLYSNLYIKFMSSSRKKTEQRDSLKSTGQNSEDNYQRAIKTIGFEDNLRGIVKNAKLKGIEIGAIRYPWRVNPRLSIEDNFKITIGKNDDFIRKYVKIIPLINDAYDKIIAEFNLTSFSPFGYFRNERFLDIYSDNLHLAKKGNYLIALCIYEGLLKNPPKGFPNISHLSKEKMEQEMGDLINFHELGPCVIIQQSAKRSIQSSILETYMSKEIFDQEQKIDFYHSEYKKDYMLIRCKLIKNVRPRIFIFPRYVPDGKNKIRVSLAGEGKKPIRQLLELSDRSLSKQWTPIGVPVELKNLPEHLPNKFNLLIETEGDNCQIFCKDGEPIFSNLDLPFDVDLRIQ